MDRAGTRLPSVSLLLLSSAVSGHGCVGGFLPKGKAQETEEANMCSDICQCPVVMTHSWRSRGVTGNQSHRLYEETQRGRRPAIDTRRRTDIEMDTQHFEATGQVANKLDWKDDMRSPPVDSCRALPFEGLNLGFVDMVTE
ncbi:unnamed protein product [Pleuronectes platessa]|uniref:Uncharacterized protein n=1 Tax=Pleuronectes platessa TaxID=8262 RepID=A0A9N7VEG6_PLEPL|nr:unnamed protein product [Pleuronectes platessa]